MNKEDLLNDVKKNLIIDFTEDDSLILTLIAAAISYAESYQHLEQGYYLENVMTNSTRQGIIMLTSHFYESRDGSTGGFFADNTNASNNVWACVNTLLRLDREWKV